MATPIPTPMTIACRIVAAPRVTSIAPCLTCYALMLRATMPDGRVALLDPTPARYGAVVIEARNQARPLGPDERTPLDRYDEHQCPRKGASQ